MEQESWDEVYSKKFGGSWYPNEGIVRFTARYLKRRMGIDVIESRSDAKRVLDIGCGNGRHVVFFAELGFEAYGMDISSEAVEIGKAWLNKNGLEGDLGVGDVESLPYEDGFFDVVVSYGVLDHIPMEKARKAMDEVRRVLKPGGMAFITLRSSEDSECGRGEQTEKNTYVLAGGYEKGIIQHFFDLGEVTQLFGGFRVFDLELYEQRFPDLYTVDKAYLQSSTGEKKILELSGELDMNLKYSRWHITAQRE